MAATPVTFGKCCKRFCSEIGPADRRRVLEYFDASLNLTNNEDVIKDMTFINKLMDEKILLKGDASRLISCLKKLNLKSLAKHWEEYQATIPRDRAADDDTGCPHVTIDDYRVFCITCCKPTCYKCGFFHHKKHEVVPKQKLSERVNEYRKVIEEKLLDTEEMMASHNKPGRSATNISEQRYREIEEFFQGTKNSVRCQYKQFGKKVSVVNKHFENKKKDFVHNLNRREQLCGLINRKLELDMKGSGVTTLQRLKAQRKQIEREIKATDIEKDKLSESEMNILLSIPSISANLVDVILGPVVGAVLVNSEEVVIVFDQRKPEKPAFHLICTSYKETGQVRWSHSIILGTSDRSALLRSPPVVVCGSLLAVNSEFVIGIGCGHRLFFAKINIISDTLCKFVSVSVRNLPLKEGSDVRSLSCLVELESVLKGSFEMVMSETLSRQILTLDKDINVIHRFESSYFCKSVTGFRMFGFNVLQFATENTVYFTRDASSSRVDTLTSPGTIYIPQDLFNEVVFFHVLWVTRQTNDSGSQMYKVSLYTKDGRYVKDRCEGECSPGVNAIALTQGHAQPYGLVCFSNGKFMMYESMAGEVSSNPDFPNFRGRFGDLSNLADLLQQFSL